MSKLTTLLNTIKSTPVKSTLIATAAVAGIIAVGYGIRVIKNSRQEAEAALEGELVDREVTEEKTNEAA